MRSAPWPAALAAALLLAAPSVGAQAADTVPARPPAADSAAPDPYRAFVVDLADPAVAASALALGLYDHVRTHPEEWGGGTDALTARILSRAGGHLIGTSVRHGVAAALGRSTAYEPCACEGTEARVYHAFVETFTDRDRTGRRVLSEPFLAGTYAAALAPVLWHPDAELMDALQSGTLSILFTLTGRVIFALVEPPSS